MFAEHSHCKPSTSVRLLGACVTTITHQNTTGNLGLNYITSTGKSFYNILARARVTVTESSDFEFLYSNLLRQKEVTSKLSFNTNPTQYLLNISTRQLKITISEIHSCPLPYQYKLNY